MPSSMSAPSNDIPPLTNEEIETLYDIVRDAQSLPDPPYRALFKAYDRILAQKRKTDNDGRYFTFLIRMQDDALSGHEELVDRFQRLLAAQGIQVEIDPEGEGVEVTTNLDIAAESGPIATRNAVPLARSRRGSFESFFDGSADKVPGTEYDLPVRSRRLSVAASDTGETRDARRMRPGLAGHAPLPRQLPFRGRVSTEEHRRAASVDYASQRRLRRTGSVDSRGSLRIRRDEDTGIQDLGDGEGEFSDHTDSFDRSHVQIPGVNVPLPDAGGGHQEYGFPTTPYRPSDTQIERDAETFVYHRGLALKRAYLQKWRTRLAEHLDKQQRMEAAAIAFERRVLLKASLDSWRIAFQSRRQAAETERFFQRLERRAEKARNLFLLTKAFTHWAKSAEDEVQRTSTARRHILRTKYFNAWRDITAVNELKIQHFVLAKFLDIWRSRTAAVREQSDLAVNLYEHNIVYRLYWQWFWKFGERRAPILHRIRLARETLRKWAEIVTILKEREQWASQQRDLQILRTSFSKLKERAARISSAELEADAFRRAALLSSAFYVLRNQAQLVPLQRRFVEQRNARLLHFSFQAWRRDAQHTKQAREVDRLRLLRNGFTAWNDRLRVKALQEQIGERIQLQCLYKWALASRVSLFQRVHNHRLKEKLFSDWAAKTENQENTLDRAEKRFAAFKRAQLLRSSLRKIESATVQRRGQEFLAVSVYEPRLKQRIFAKLLEKHAHLQQLDTWAERANYYVTAKNALKRWQGATEHARRVRRREAYAHMRRTVKLNLVRRTFAHWRDKSARLVECQREADDMARSRVVRTATALLRQWHDQIAHLRELETRAVQTHAQKLNTTTLAIWVDKMRGLQEMSIRAVALRNESTQIAASGCLKKLSWKVWTVKRQEETANALRGRNFEKHVRAMVRFWWEQTAERLAQKEEEEGSPSPARRRQDEESDGGGNEGDADELGELRGPDNGGDGAGDAGIHHEENEPRDETQRPETWTPFNEDALRVRELDLSFSVSPQHSQSRPRTVVASAPRPAPLRPNTYPQPQPRSEPRRGRRWPQPTTSILRRRPLDNPFPPITEASDSAPEASALDLDTHLDLEAEVDPASTFWTSTPMPPPRLEPRKAPGQNKPMAAGTQKPGYLRTPSRRAIVRERTRNQDVLGSPSKSRVGVGLRVGARSAPPGRGYRGLGERGLGGITSFEDKLREGGFEGRNRVGFA
ncbi:Sfi1-domain-containing protein [Westerdykella ornata]|uniref:Sfi1-domain-containing protein n=1 Tax=Westerdykella ornata TaxID=318751 RepID=A0A6A6JG99_WESOR|nr:Sfi1-domain-containing protein [Westerdykella ornata]KAF2275367.1 Sfi1-domain-containing protein [Westerdykella ornata]